MTHWLNNLGDMKSIIYDFGGTGVQESFRSDEFFLQFSVHAIEILAELLSGVISDRLLNFRNVLEGTL